MSVERWKPIANHPGCYVSSHGRIKRKQKRGPDLISTGVLQVQFKVNGVPIGYKVARLVAAAFCSKFSPELVVTHRDGNPANCHVRNLKLLTKSEVTKATIPYRKKRYPEKPQDIPTP